MKRESIPKLIWRIAYPLIIYFGISIVVQIIGTVILSAIVMVKEPGMSESLYMTKLLESVDRNTMYISMVSDIITIPVLYLFFMLDKKKMVQEKRDVVSKPAPFYTYMLPFVTGVAACVGFNFIIDISGLINIFPGYNDVAELLYSGGIVVELIVIAVLAPVIEELLFRGLVHKRLRGNMGAVPASFVSALIFGVMHLNVVQGLYAFLIGLVLAFVYEKYKSVAAPMLLHAGANLFSVIITESVFLQEFFGVGIHYTICGLICLAVVAVMIYIIMKHIKVHYYREEEDV